MKRVVWPPQVKGHQTALILHTHNNNNVSVVFHLYDNLSAWDGRMSVCVSLSAAADQ